MLCATIAKTLHQMPSALCEIINEYANDRARQCLGDRNTYEFGEQVYQLTNAGTIYNLTKQKTIFVISDHIPHLTNLSYVEYDTFHVAKIYDRHYFIYTVKYNKSIKLQITDFKCQHTRIIDFSPTIALFNISNKLYQVDSQMIYQYTHDQNLNIREIRRHQLPTLYRFIIIIDNTIVLYNSQSLLFLNTDDMQQIGSHVFPLVDILHKKQLMLSHETLETFSCFVFEGRSAREINIYRYNGFLVTVKWPDGGALALNDSHITAHHTSFKESQF